MRNLLSSLCTAAFVSALGLGFAAAPVSVSVSDGAIAFHASKAFARRGADDPAGHVRGGQGADDPAGHVRGGRGADDPAGDDHGGTKAGDDKGGKSGASGKGSTSGKSSGKGGKGRGGHDDGANHK